MRSNTALRLVSNNAKKLPKPEPRPDPIFFIKKQVQVGTHLLCLGRLERPSAWVVSRIISYAGNGKPKRVDEVQYLSDRVYLHRVNGHADSAERSGTFGYLSYSAIWRIA